MWLLHFGIGVAVAAAFLLFLGTLILEEIIRTRDAEGVGEALGAEAGGCALGCLLESLLSGCVVGLGAVGAVLLIVLPR